MPGSPPFTPQTSCPRSWTAARVPPCAETADEPRIRAPMTSPGTSRFTRLLLSMLSLDAARLSGAAALA